MKWLQKEFKRCRRDDSAVNDRMDRTFYQRMTTIDNCPVSEVLEQYVFLRDSKQVNAFILIVHLVMMMWLKW